jgi:hypothetical protein
MKRVKAWRKEAHARGVVIGPRKHRYPAKRARGRRRGQQSCTAHWAEMVQWLEEHPDSTGMELLTEFQARYPGYYNRSHLRTLRLGRLASRNHSAIDLRNERTDARRQCQWCRTILRSGIDYLYRIRRFAPGSLPRVEDVK